MNTSLGAFALTNPIWVRCDGKLTTQNETELGIQHPVKRNQTYAWSLQMHPKPSYNLSLNWSGSGDLDLLLIDPLGRRTGYDWIAGLELREIPDSGYSGHLAKPEWISVKRPSPGSWRILIHSRMDALASLKAEPLIPAPAPIPVLLEPQQALEAIIRRLEQHDSQEAARLRMMLSWALELSSAQQSHHLLMQLVHAAFKSLLRSHHESMLDLLSSHNASMLREHAQLRDLILTILDQHSSRLEPEPRPFLSGISGELIQIQLWVNGSAKLLGVQIQDELHPQLKFISGVSQFRGELVPGQLLSYSYIVQIPQLDSSTQLGSITKARYFDGKPRAQQFDFKVWGFPRDHLRILTELLSAAQEYPDRLVMAPILAELSQARAEFLAQRIPAGIQHLEQALLKLLEAYQATQDQRIWMLGAHRASCATGECRARHIVSGAVI